MNLPQTTHPNGARGNRRLIAQSVTAWGFIRQELLYLSFALMEIALVTPIALVISGWARYWPATEVALLLLLVMLIPFNLIRLMGLLYIDLKRQQWVLVILLLIVILISWRLLLYNATSLFDFGWLQQFANSLGEGGNLLWTRDLTVFVMIVFAWWRGTRLAVRRPEINNTGLRLRLGGLVFLPLIIWFASGFLEANIVPFVLLFFLSSLTVISLVRAENIEQERSGTSATLNARWFAAVAIAALAIVILSGIITALATGNSIFTVMAWLSPLWRALQFAATVAGVILFELTNPFLEFIAQVVQFLANFLVSLMGQLSGSFTESPPVNPFGTPEFLTPTEAVEVVGPTITSKATTAVIMLGLILLIALALARTYQKASFAARESDRSRAMRRDNEEPGRGRRILDRFEVFRQWRAAVSVRRIYRLMCQEAAAAGYPRTGNETPYEYLPALARVWPDHSAETRAITEAFIRVRYGEVPETEPELDAIRASWRTLEGAEINRRQFNADPTPTLEKRD